MIFVILLIQMINLIYGEGDSNLDVTGFCLFYLVLGIIVFRIQELMRIKIKIN